MLDGRDLVSIQASLFLARPRALFYIQDLVSLVQKVVHNLKSLPLSILPCILTMTFCFTNSE